MKYPGELLMDMQAINKLIVLVSMIVQFLTSGGLVNVSHIVNKKEILSANPFESHL